MQDCIHKVIYALRDKSQPEIQERLLEATLLVEKSNGWDSYFGISTAVDSAEFTPEDIVQLQNALIDFAKANREHPAVGTALWALGKYQEKGLRSFFLNEMKYHLEAGHVHAVWQADSALDSLGDGVDYKYAVEATSDEEYLAAVRLYIQKRSTEF